MGITPADLATILRMQAWERAKGELQAVLQTYFPSDAPDGFDRAKKKIDDFITDFEGWCC